MGVVFITAFGIRGPCLVARGSLPSQFPQLCLFTAAQPLSCLTIIGVMYRIVSSFLLIVRGLWVFYLVRAICRSYYFGVGRHSKDSSVLYFPFSGLEGPLWFGVYLGCLGLYMCLRPRRRTPQQNFSKKNILIMHARQKI